MTSSVNTKSTANISQLLALESTAERPEQLRAALRFVKTALAKIKGLTVENFESGGKPSLLAYYGDKRPDQFDVILNAHVDVVPADPEQFIATVRNGRLYGRGAADMKAATVVMTEVFCELAPHVPYALGLQVVTDEEVGGHHGTAYQIQKGVRSKFVLAGEDTPKNAICIAMCGTCWVEFEVTGRGAHSGYVWRGDNAVIKASNLIQRLLQEFPLPTDDTWVTTANIAYFETPKKLFNRVPDIAKFGVDFRYIPTDRRFSSRQAVENYLKSLDPSANFQILQYEPSHSVDAANLQVLQLAAAAHQVTGTSPTFVRRHGAADVRFFSSNGAAAVTMGLPDNGTHSTDEYVELADIASYREVLRLFLSNFSHSSLQKS